MKQGTYISLLNYSSGYKISNESNLQTDIGIGGTKFKVKNISKDLLWESITTAMMANKIYKKVSILG